MGCVWNGIRTCDCFCHDMPKYCEECSKKSQTRSGEMANTEDLKSSEAKPLVGSSPTSGISDKILKEQQEINNLDSIKKDINLRSWTK